MTKKRIAVIGAGASGLVSIKCCLDEDLEPVCFEMSGDIGGLWRFEEEPKEGRASIYRSVIINTSKEMMCYSDFPIPEDYPNFMHNSKIMEYFRMYAKHFDLLKYIRFRTKVCNISKSSDFAETGQWNVVTETNEKQESSVFDGIMVCTGHHTNAYLPLHSFPGIEKFKGRYIHSRDYKDPTEFKGKRVIVVGIGNSGVDIAVEISQVASQVFLSTRRGAWIINRVWDGGEPQDLFYNQRFFHLLFKCHFLRKNLHFLAKRKLNKRFNHALYGLQPQHRLDSQHPTINDDLPNRIISGRVVIKPNIKEFTETSVLFDGSKEDDIDFVVFATGYSFSFPFLDNCISVADNQVTLYKYIFPPLLEKPTLAIIGLIQPLGAIMPISELQARWVTRVFKGLCELPLANDMLEDIRFKEVEMAKRYVRSRRHTIQVDYIEYMDEIAALIPANFNMWLLFLKDPKLAWEVLFGPCTPYQYRLQGPGKWDKARKAILTQHERIRKPFRTRAVPDSLSQSRQPLVFKAFLAVAIVTTLLGWFEPLSSLVI
ncbi:flavin-containing monooxygenase 5-like [Heteronotia binoei]|uniref:flavin-containing monooxygenase 5-like n=1 Tax=Heteronotia binoei TaxID=13085 RepID=UPI00292D4425|nr:flavin-containing monooxygenase 5-like [Heteronotia binoei]